ncbi:BTAD domain-containing putative transcriptional regulator [Streptomyces sp. A012304]|uniref:AfsR/SARP family transcriptional regulator n=1 Tax=Streptomyces sp. A012304 TaxID=375446 RepID=UPI002231A5F3|nr:BTAD domain-containing putative transcriptional regulator [Streptomyces sp. A012304]GKQ39449.1 SARP family transcriptional regulator [Streptomyces sp. A012304]
MAVEFRLLDDIAAYVDGVALELGPPQQRSVLAVLLVEAPRHLSTEQLIGRVWGDRPPQRVKGTLYSYLSRLRGALAPAEKDAVIARRSGGYALVVDRDTVDLHRFRLLVEQARAADEAAQAAMLFEQAFTLWLGEPLELGDTPWFRTLRESLLRERWAAVLDRNDVLLRLGHHGELLAELSRWVEQHPLDERLAGQYLLALYRSGHTADALSAYEDVRRRLAQELGVDLGPHLRTLHQQILTNDAVLAPPPRTPTALAARPVPRQLPAPATRLIGRAGELRHLDELLAPKEQRRAAMPVSVICGAGGTGKTWLALSWAHDHLRHFPDGQLFVDLRGYTPSAEPLDPSLVIRGFLDTLGVDAEDIPADPDTQAALYRSLVADKRMLIMLDNARDTRHVLPLLPGSPTCTVMITSRHQLTGLVASHQPVHVTLGTFDHTTARELLGLFADAERITAEPDATTALVDHCAGLPLALSVLAARISTNPALTLTALAAELRDSAHRLDVLETGESGMDVRTVFASSYQALDHETAQVFRQLAQAPGPDISLPAAASLTALPAARLRTVLRRLQVAHLLQEHAPGRFSYHDLLRAYAIELADVTDGCQSRAALTRVLDHYLLTAVAADRLLLPYRDPIHLPPTAEGVRPEDITSHEQAMAWFTREHPVLIAAVPHAARAGHDTHTWQLAWALTTFLTRRGRWTDVAAIHTTALAAATRLKNPAAQAESHRALAWERTEAGDTRTAYSELTRALTIAAENGDALSQAHTHLALGWLYEREGDQHAALRHDRQALDLFDSLAHRPGLARALNAVAWDHGRQGNHQEAVDHCHRALGIQTELGDRRGQAATLDTLGCAYQDAGDHRRALTCHQRALAIHRALGHRYNEAEALIHLCRTQQALGDRHAAGQALEQALAIYREIQVPESCVEEARALLRALQAGGAAECSPAQSS